jgi:hypothetical protein
VHENVKNVEIVDDFDLDIQVDVDDIDMDMDVHQSNVHWFSSSHLPDMAISQSTIDIT